MASKFDKVPEDVLKEAAENSSPESKNPDWKKFKPDPAQYGTGETKQKRLFKKRRAGVVLSEEEVKAIKQGRKKLRREMRQRGIRSKREFELVAGSLGLYFDKRRGGLLPWLMAHWLGVLIAALLALIIIIFIFSAVTRLRGYYTINLSDDLFREGFVLSETEDFAHPSVELFAPAAENVPCISIKHIPNNVHMIDGEHNDTYFAYTYYIRNEGESTVDIAWDLVLNSESKNLSDATWMLLFVDGKMTLMAEANKQTGKQEAIPAFGDDTKGYLDLPITELDPDSKQFEVIKTAGGRNYYRVIPETFKSDTVITSGDIFEVKPGDVHKFTVVLWLEGDDIDCDNSKIGGHLGVQMDFHLAGLEEDDNTLKGRLKKFWNSLSFRDQNTNNSETTN
jgi:hypothetical protein